MLFFFIFFQALRVGVRADLLAAEYGDEKIVSLVLPNFYLRPNWLWQRPLPKVREVLKELAVT